MREQQPFNFGQYIQSANDEYYIDIKGELNIDEDNSTPTKKLYNLYSSNNYPITNGTFYLKCLIKPKEEQTLTMSIKLIKENNEEFSLKENIIIKPATDYLSDLETLNTDLAYLKGQKISKEEDYRQASDALNVCVQNVNSAKQAWENAGAKTEGNEYLAYIRALNVFNDTKITVENDEVELNNLRSQYDELLSHYNELLNNLTIPVEVSFTLSEGVEYNHILLEFSCSSEIDMSEGFSVQFLKLKELLNNIIPQRVLKRIAVQGPTNTKIFINGNQLTIGTTNILEISNPHFQISSLKILPSDFFIIDYEYLEGQQT